MTEINVSTADFLDVCELYYKGKVNIEEATALIWGILPELKEKAIMDMLEGFERDNVVPFGK